MIEEATKNVDRGNGGKPLQVLSYTEKMKDDCAWGKATSDFLIRAAGFNSITSTKAGVTSKLADFTKRDLFRAYNNDIPAELFTSVLNPLGSTDPKYLKFPAEPRPYNIIRPNIDLFIGEWNKRTFQYDVVNADGDDVFSTFEMARTKTFHDNVTQRFVNTYGQLSGNEAAANAIPDPQTLFSEFSSNYKDAKALQGYRALKTMELELKLREKWRKMFKDWTIGGDCYSFKMPMHDSIHYDRLSPLWVQGDKGAFSPYLEDGDSAVAYFRVTPSDVVDMFYDRLDYEQLKKIDASTGTNYCSAFFMGTQLVTSAGHVNPMTTVDLWFTCWKAKKKLGFLTYPDPMTGQEQHDIVDEAYKVQEEFGESVEWFWGNEIWYDWRIGDKYHVITEPVPVQRTEINNFASCKLPINGKRFSDTEAENVSLVMLGMPYQILYIILMYRLELTIAKSKGKIVLLDKGVIPPDDEGGEEGFFWYAEAMGFGLIEPEGGDPRYNQYQALDLSLFEHIKELMGIIDYVKAQWDELLGITRQRKGQLAASDGLGTAEQAIFRSSVISDLIFTGFEEFLEKELSGLLDLSKYAWIEGKNASYRNDDGKMEMFRLDGEEHAYSSYGVFIQNMSAMLDKFNAIKQQVNAIAQRKDVKISTVISLLTTDSLTELMALTKKAEAVEQKIIEQTAENDQQAKKELEESKHEWAEFMHYLEVDKMEKEADRLDNREYIKASLDKDPGAGIDPYLSVVEQEATKRLDSMQKAREESRRTNIEAEKLKIQREKIAADERNNIRDNKTKLKNKVAGEK